MTSAHELHPAPKLPLLPPPTLETVETGQIPRPTRHDPRVCLATGCDKSLAGYRSNAKCCSTRCRVRVHRAGGASRSQRLASRWGIELRDFWRTPPWFFAALDAEFHFGLDAAAAGTDDALCERFITPDDNALFTSWAERCDPERPWVYINPPYSKKAGRGKGLLLWVQKAVVERDAGVGVAMVVPPAPSTRYHKLLKAECVELRHPPSRLPFIHPDTGVPMRGNRGDTMVALLEPGRRGPAVESYCDRLARPRLSRTNRG